VLHGARGAYRLRQLPATLEVPPTVEAVLAARLDRLPPAAKRLLQEAAVLGREVPRALLEALAQRPAAAIERGLAQLQAGEFLYETGAWSAPSYRFTHALTREVAYESLPPARRRALHARTLELLEQGDGEEQAAQVDWLAHHAVRGAAWVQAVRYCRRAGAKALAQSAYQEAAVYLEQALEALSRLPEGHDTLVQGIDLRLELRTALQALGAFGKIPGHLQVADTLAQRLADPGRQGWVAAYLSAHAFNTGALGEAQTAGQRALALAQPQEGAALEVLATYVVGLAALAQGDYPEALRHLGARLDALTREHPHDPYGLPGPAAVLARAWAAGGWPSSAPSPRAAAARKRRFGSPRQPSTPSP
jgi:predicted ATPase